MKKIFYVLTIIFALLSSQNLGAQEEQINGNPWFQAATLKALGGEKSADGNYYLYVYADFAGRQLRSLQVFGYDNALTLNQTSVADVTLLAQGASTSDGGPSIFAAPLQEAGVYRIQAEYTTTDGGDIIIERSCYYENGEAYEYASDLPYVGRVGYGTIKENTSIENGTIILNGQSYAKGFGIHSQSWITFTITPGKYSRFVTAAGVQNAKNGKADAQLKFDTNVVEYVPEVTKDNITYWDREVPENTTQVTVDFFQKNYGISQGHSCIGGSRFYLRPARRTPQSITWKEEVSLTLYKRTVIDLDAKSSAEAELHYRIVKGGENATISHDSKLIINKFDSNIVVEAYQPGNNDWEPAPIKTCVFRIKSGAEVKAGETLELNTGDVVDELTVYGNGNTYSEVQTNGLPKVNKVIYKHKFRPSAWNFMSFPSSVNLDEVSNLNELGYRLNAPTGEASYFIMEYNTINRANNPNSTSWTPLKEARLEANKGYLIGINNILTSDSVEVTFTLDNVNLKLPGEAPTSTSMTADLSECEPGSKQVIYVRPTNIKGNTLRIEVDFNPEDLSALPVNHEKALAEARITHTPGYEGIRITLPDATLAKVAIYDKEGEQLIKAVNYVSPMMINVSDMKAGTYRVYISYGSAYAEKTFELPERK